MKSRAIFRLLLVRAMMMLLCLSGMTVSAQVAMEQATVNQPALQEFVNKTFRRPIEIESQKQSKRTGNSSATYVAVLCVDHLQGYGGLLVMKTDGNVFQLVWSSLKHNVPLGVTSARNFVLREAQGRQFFTLYGCYAHLCGASGMYHAETFDVSSGHMRIFDISGCGPRNGDPSEPKPVMCVTDTNGLTFESQPGLKEVLADLVRDLTRQPGALVQFQGR